MCIASWLSNAQMARRSRRGQHVGTGSDAHGTAETGASSPMMNNCQRLLLELRELFRRLAATVMWRTDQEMRIAEQIVDVPVLKIESPGEAGSSWSRTSDTTSTTVTAVGATCSTSVGEARPWGLQSTLPRQHPNSQCRLVKLGRLGPSRQTRLIPSRQNPNPQVLLMMLGLMGLQRIGPRQNPNSPSSLFKLDLLELQRTRPRQNPKS